MIIDYILWILTHNYSILLHLIRVIIISAQPHFASLYMYALGHDCGYRRSQHLTIIGYQLKQSWLLGLKYLLPSMIPIILLIITAAGVAGDYNEIITYLNTWDINESTFLLFVL